MKKWIVFCSAVMTLWAGCPHPKQKMVMDFDSVRVGELPAGWFVSQTGKKSAAIWEVDGQKRLAILYPRGYTSKERNLFVTKDLYFSKGSVAATIWPKSDAGVLFWFKDRKDYYDVRLDGDRIVVEKIADGQIEPLIHKRVPLDPKPSHRLEVDFCSDRIVVWLDGRKVLAKKISKFLQGGAGVIASGKSKSLFDDIVIEAVE